MVRFLIFVWLPVFIPAKCQQSNGFCGPELLLLEVKLAKQYLSFEHFQAVKDRIDLNGQFAYHENILLGMLCSESSTQRSVAVEVISEVRSKPVSVSANAKQRLFTRDGWKVNEYAQSLSNLSSLPLFDCQTEPPMTKHLSNAELESLCNCKGINFKQSDCCCLYLLYLHELADKKLSRHSASRSSCSTFSVLCALSHESTGS